MQATASPLSYLVLMRMRRDPFITVSNGAVNKEVTFPKTSIHILKKKAQHVNMSGLLREQ